MYQLYSHMPLLLSGGVFQNSILCKLILQRFEDAIIPDTISVNDSAIALGQILGSINNT
jgi:hydrogenase maturation factor HypF (carbamoyltransferase family)